jgi:hypothetical protein
MSKATLTRGRTKRSIACTAILVALLLSSCATPYATVRNKAGEDVMLLGHDPVAYFKLGKSVRGDPAIKQAYRLERISS